jgi:hypothetical protein
MASLSYSFATLKNAVRHALGGEPDSRTSAAAIVNRAIDFLCTWHSWTWRTKLTTLDFVADAGEILLPADFGELLELFGYESKYTTCEPVSHRKLLALRVHGPGNGAYLGFLIGQQTQTDTALAPRRTLEVAPVPAASMTNALYLMYRKLSPAYAESGTTDDAKIVDLPINLHVPLYHLCRAMALSEEEGGGDMSLALQAMEAAKTADAKANPSDLGPVQGGLVDEWYQGGGFCRPHTEIQTAYD